MADDPTDVDVDEALSELVDKDAQLIERRQRVVQLMHRRMNQSQVAAALKVHPATVTRDLQAIRRDRERLYGPVPQFEAASFVGESRDRYEDIFTQAMYDSAKAGITIKEKALMLMTAMNAQDRIIALLQDTGQVARASAGSIGLPSAAQIRAGLLAAASMPKEFEPPPPDIIDVPTEKEGAA